MRVVLVAVVGGAPNTWGKSFAFLRGEKSTELFYIRGVIKKFVDCLFKIKTR